VLPIAPVAAVAQSWPELRNISTVNADRKANNPGRPIAHHPRTVDYLEQGTASAARLIAGADAGQLTVPCN
jgi:hypothetical protein